MEKNGGYGANIFLIRISGQPSIPGNLRPGIETREVGAPHDLCCPSMASPPDSPSWTEYFFKIVSNLRRKLRRSIASSILASELIFSTQLLSHHNSNSL